MPLAFITGRTPALSRLEIEAAATTLPFQWSLLMVHPDVCLLKSTNEADEKESLEKYYQSNEIQKLQARLGGTQKIARLDKHVKQDQLVEALLAELATSDGTERLTFGLSIYGRGVSALKLGLTLKKHIKKQGRSVRFVTPVGGEILSSAQIVGNKLTETDGMELLAVWDNGWHVGHTLTVQDINSYNKRDIGIPVPDPVSGMLSPKLAQIMINLGLEGKEATVYDPFCGNGRIVEEARLMGLEAFGSDILQSQVDASHKNLAWIATEYELKVPNEVFFQYDATKPGAAERLQKMIGEGPWHIVSEPYLGKPLRAPLTQAEQGPWLKELVDLYLAFLKTWAGAPYKPDSMLLVFPAAQCQDGSWLSLFSEVVDRLAGFGYSAVQVSDYGRPDAHVRRELVRIDFK